MTIPEGMTADKLRFIANYIDECDSIIEVHLRNAKEAGHPDITDEMLEFVSGKAVQKDLLKWADELDG